MNSVLGNATNATVTNATNNASFAYASYSNNGIQTLLNNTINSNDQLILFQSVDSSTPELSYSNGAFTFNYDCVLTFSYSVLVTNAVATTSYFSYGSPSTVGKWFDTGPILKSTDATNVVVTSGTNIIKVLANSPLRIFMSVIGPGLNGAPSGNVPIGMARISFIFHQVSRSI